MHLVYPPKFCTTIFFDFSWDDCITLDKLEKKMVVQNFGDKPQAAQTHVAREGCNVIYITYVTRAGVALQATVENIRDFVWEIYH